jgi:hypothetical protein
MSIPNYLNSTLKYIFLRVKVIKIATTAPYHRLLDKKYLQRLMFTLVATQSLFVESMYGRKKSTERKWECRGLD